MKFVKRLITSTLLTFSVFFLQAQCLEVNSIFVNSCGPTEGENEMFTFQTGSSALNVNDISVNWPNAANSFLGWCQNATTINATAALNATILTSCGWLLEPTGGVIPAGADVIVITSTSISVADNSFEGLADTMYIVYQCAGNTAGHFANSFSGSRTLQVLVTGACVQIEEVTYDGNVPNGDGATALFDAAGNVSYINNGCNAPVITLSAGWSFTDIICTDYGNVDLNSLLAPNATLGGVWSGPRVSGSTYNSGSYIGLDSITYSVANPGGCSGSLDSTIVFVVDTPATGSEELQACDSLNYNSVWYSSDIILNESVLATNPFYCDSFFTVDITITSAIRDSSYFEACTSFTFDGNIYTNDTILYDTLRAGGSTGANSCTELFISEYGEGSSSNKYIEIYNGTGANVDLSTYSIANFNNGTTTPGTTEILSGTLADGDVFVISSLGASATIAAQTDLYSNALFINGNDALALYNSGVLIDLIGNIGCDPGTQWTNGTLSTFDQTLVRNASYTTGVTVDPINTPCDFPTLNTANWTNLGIDTWTNLGTHTSTCGGTITSGCDTIVVTEIKINSEINRLVDTASCDSLEINGVWYFNNTSVNETIAGAANACDTIVTYNITINNSIITTSSSTSCNPNDVGVNQSGPFTLANNCDSTHFDTVSLAPFSSITINTFGCESLNLLGLTITNDTLVSDTTTFPIGCDSITNYQVTIYKADTIFVEVCTNNPQEAGIDEVSIQNAVGCDSLVTITTTTLVATSSNIIVVCTNDATLEDDTSSIIQSNFGCDSIYNITTYQFSSTPLNVSVSATICQGDSVFLEGDWQTQAGIYQDITVLSSGCDSITNTTLTIENPTLTITQNTTICIGAEIELEASGTQNIVWSTGEIASIINVSPVTETTYTATGTSGNNCTATASVTISVEDSIRNVSLSASDTSIEAGQTVSILVNASNVQNYEWTPVTAFTNEIEDMPLSTTTYVVTLSNESCPSVVDSITIVVIPLEVFTPQMPTAFSPNNDGVNDLFRPANYEQYESYLLKVYDRWGNLIFTENGFAVAWNGIYISKMQNIGVYTYYLDAKPFNPLIEQQIQSGSFTLIR